MTDPAHCDSRRFVSGKALFAVGVWGVSFVATRVALEGFNPFSLVAVRLTMGAALLGSITKTRGDPFLPARGDRWICTFLGVVLGVHLLIQAYGLQYTSAIHTGWIIGFIPVTIAIGAHALGQQRLRMTGWGGVTVGTVGVLLITMSSPPDFEKATFGDALQLASCLTWTVYTLTAGGVVARNGALRVTTFAMVIAAGMATVCVVRFGVLRGDVTARVVVATVYLGVVSSGVAFYLWLRAQHEHGPTRIGSLLYFEPFFTVVAAVVLIDEPITANAIGGGVVVLIGVWLVSRGTAHRSG